MGKLPVTGINHICVATTDLDRSMRSWYEN